MIRRKAREPTIFVALAAYCEPELDLTIRDLLAKARHPGRLRFGVCLQYDQSGEPEMHEDCIDHFLDDERFQILKADHRVSEGGCWARFLTQGLYRGEDYTLQIDTHSRVVENWDVRLTSMLRDLPSEKPLITGFPPLYDRRDGHDDFSDHEDLSLVPTTIVEDWAEDGWINHPTKLIEHNRAMPRRTRVLSGAFVFTLGRWNVEVRQDPKHIFTGEEFALTLRSFTWGYDLFNPTSVVIWHRHHPGGNRKYITDFPRDVIDPHHQRACARLRTLLAGDPGGELEPFSIGPVRGLDAYYVFSGLDCDAYTIHPDARDGVPPDPVTIRDQR